MQNVVFVGRLAGDPEISSFGEGRSKAIFRLLENRGKDKDDNDRVVGVNCVSWSHGLNEKVIAGGLAKGCEAMVIGYFIDNSWQGQDGKTHYGKELVVERLRVLDWAARADQRLAA